MYVDERGRVRLALTKINVEEEDKEVSKEVRTGGKRVRES